VFNLTSKKSYAVFRGKGQYATVHKFIMVTIEYRKIIIFAVVDDTELLIFFIVFQHKLKVDDVNIVQLSTMM